MRRKLSETILAFIALYQFRFEEYNLNLDKVNNDDDIGF